MKKKLFNVTVYGMLLWSILSAGYLMLPVEYQEMIPQYNWLTAVISGGSTLLLGSGGLAVQNWLTKAKTVSDEKYNILAQKFLTLAGKYDNMANKNDELIKAIARNNALLEVDLKTKMSNPLIDITSKELIEGVLYGQEKE